MGREIQSDCGDCSGRGKGSDGAGRGAGSGWAQWTQDRVLIADGYGTRLATNGRRLPIYGNISLIQER